MLPNPRRQQGALHLQEPRRRSAIAKVLARAVAAAWRVGATSGLLPELRAELMATSGVEKMLRQVFLGASGAVNTWRAAVRAVECWEQWATAHALEPHSWTGIQLSRFLSDAGHSGDSVPGALRAGLKMFSDTLLLQWPLDHPWCKQCAGLRSGHPTTPKSARLVPSPASQSSSFSTLRRLGAAKRSPRPALGGTPRMLPNACMSALLGFTEI